MRSRVPAFFRFTLAFALAGILCGIAGAIPFKRHKEKEKPGPVQNSLQLLLVMADRWDSHMATLRRFERTKPGVPWTQVGLPISVDLGKKGLAWGRGLHDTPRDGLVKEEGDGKSPAGVFEIGTAFGQSHDRLAGLQLPYMAMVDHIECVDDPKSRYYNRFITRLRAAKLDWESYEEMWSQPLYRWGAVIEHNTAHTQPGAGSCIFLHISDGTGEGTAGCTAMDQLSLVRVLTWLNPDRRPVLVQLPNIEYERLKIEWGLP